MPKRVAKEERKERVASIRLTNQCMELLSKLAKERKQSKSDVLRDVVVKILNEDE